VFRRLTARKTLLTAAVLAITTAFAYHAAGHPMDFRVYHYGARGVFDGTRPMYGPGSGLGWPMHYRYPPLFMLIFAPLAALPLASAAALWVTLKVAVLVLLIQAMFRRFELETQSSILLKPQGALLLLPGLLFIAPYLVEEFRYGNAQFFIFALTAAALLLARERPAPAAACLALAISIKVWPLFFLPYLAIRRDTKLVAYTLILVVALALLPSFYFGWNGNLHLLSQWFGQEFQTQWSQSEIWFPNESLRGVLMRYLTVVDYSQMPDSNYPQVNVVAWDPSLVRFLWIVLAGGIYAMFLFFANRRRASAGWMEHGLGFCLVGLLEPFTQKYALVILLWPALTSAGAMKDSKVRLLLYCAAAVALVQPLAPGAAAQRLLQVFGADFLAASLLTAGMLVCV
jgi:Glycosyltransferase family 87